MAFNTYFRLAFSEFAAQDNAGGNSDAQCRFAAESSPHSFARSPIVPRIAVDERKEEDRRELATGTEVSVVARPKPILERKASVEPCWWANSWARPAETRIVLPQRHPVYATQCRWRRECPAPLSATW